LPGDANAVHPVLLTVGHGTLSTDALATLLGHAGVASVVAVRRFPRSRRHPQFCRDELERWLPAAGIGYRWEERLGGRRPNRSESRHVALRNDSFRAYVDWMESEDWRGAMGGLVREARGGRVAVMCSESLWWRCHRRFIADAATLLYGLQVRHLMYDRRGYEHRCTAGVRVGTGELIYDTLGELPDDGTPSTS
jgi:uncharacterized protein (DUF488 family)